jgi:hypothetical protein
MPPPQSYANHRQFVPLFHGVLGLILFLNLGWSIYRLFHLPSIDTAVSMLLAFGLILLGFFARAFAMRVQDRVIRLEMRLRLNELLPSELRPQIHTLTPGQLVALRFASDEELPALAAAVMKDGVADQNTIKKMIKQWRPDTLRA